MKTLFLSAVAAFFMMQTTYAQTTPEQVATIDQTKKDIDNNMGHYQRTEEHKNVTSTKVVYMDGCDLKLVTIMVTENNIDKTVNLYYTNGKLIYTTQVGVNNETGLVVDYERAYISNNQALVWIKNGNVAVEASSKKFKAMNTELMNYAAVLQTESLKNANCPAYTISLATN